MFIVEGDEVEIRSLRAGTMFVDRFGVVCLVVVAETPGMSYDRAIKVGEMPNKIVPSGYAYKPNWDLKVRRVTWKL
jgi:hypothetical protein